MSTSTSPGARRPLKSRQIVLFQRLATRLARAGVTPNAISLWSIAFGCAAGLAFVATAAVDAPSARRALFLAAAALIQLRLLANMLDGMVAVEGGKGSRTGDLYNEVPDRVSDAATLIGAGLGFGGDLVLGLLAALLAVLVAYVRALGASVGAGQVFLGPCAKPQRMALMTIACILCAVLPDAWQTLPVLHGSGLIAVALALVLAGSLITALRRLRRIAAILNERTPD